MSQEFITTIGSIKYKDAPFLIFDAIRQEVDSPFVSTTARRTNKIAIIPSPGFVYIPYTAETFRIQGNELPILPFDGSTLIDNLNPILNTLLFNQLLYPQFYFKMGNALIYLDKDYKTIGKGFYDEFSNPKLLSWYLYTTDHLLAATIQFQSFRNNQPDTEVRTYSYIKDKSPISFTERVINIDYN